MDDPSGREGLAVLRVWTAPSGGLRARLTLSDPTGADARHPVTVHAAGAADVLEVLGRWLGDLEAGADRGARGHPGDGPVRPGR